MDSIISLPNVPKRDFKAFNRCRLYLQVTFVSKISTATGTAIHHESWQGHQRFPSPLLWPNQPKPGPKSFRTWRRLLATAFLSGHQPRVLATTKDLTLQRPLGQWLPASAGYHTHYKNFVSRSTLSLYSHTPTGFHQHKAIFLYNTPSLLTRCFQPDLSAVTDTIPDDAVPVDATPLKTKIKIPFTLSSLQPRDPIAPTPTTWDDYVTMLPAWEQDLLLNINILDLPLLLETLQGNDPVLLLLDGGAIEFRGSFGGLIANKDTILVELGGRAQGANPRSFRSEAYGSLAIVTLCRHICIFHKIHNESLDLRFSRDNKGLVTRLDQAFDSQYKSPCSFLRSKMDVEMQVMAILLNLPGTRLFSHVHGHQDLAPRKKKLSWVATLNLRCDEIASEHLNDEDPNQQSHPPPHRQSFDTRQRNNSEPSLSSTAMSACRYPRSSCLHETMVFMATVYF